MLVVIFTTYRTSDLERCRLLESKNGKGYMLITSFSYVLLRLTSTDSGSYSAPALSKFSNVSVELIQTDLTINVVKKFNADAIIRGIRNTRDFTYEQEIALMNKKLDSDIETITLFSNPEVSFISSTLVREISQFNLDKLIGTVPDNVIEALRKKV